MATKSTRSTRSTTSSQSSRTASVPAIERKALAESNKSEGMRMLLAAGYSVARVRGVFNAPYGFVYGVALRAANAGLIDLRTVAAERAPRKADNRPAKATSRRATKATTPAPAPKRARATRPSAASTTRTAASRVAAKLASRKA